MGMGMEMDEIRLHEGGFSQYTPLADMIEPMKSTPKKRIVVGVDEVGRGPLAGPLAACALLVERRNRRYLRGVRDSKKLSEKGREEWYRKIQTLEKKGKLRCKVSFVGEGVIDKKGISYALIKAVGSCLRRLDVPKDSHVLLDGALYAPQVYIHQKTIVRGDELEACIAAASIVAKVRRDRRMRSLAKRYPEYGFEVHKGYGTKAHYAALKRHGLSDIHRRSFLKRFVVS